MSEQLAEDRNVPTNIEKRPRGTTLVCGNSGAGNCPINLVWILKRSLSSEVGAETKIEADLRLDGHTREIVIQ